MKSFQSYMTLYKMLALQDEAKDNLKKLKILSIHAFVWLVVVEFVMMLQVYPVKWFVDGLTNGAHLSYFEGIAGLTLVIYLSGSLLYARMDHFRLWAMMLNYLTILGYSHQHLLLLDTAWHSEHSTGEKESILSKNIRKIDRLTDEIIFQLIPSTLRVLFITLGVSLIGWQYSVIAVITTTCYYCATRRTEQRYEPHRLAAHAEDKAYNRCGSEQITNWRTIKQFGLEQKKSRKYIQLLDDFVEAEHLRFDSWLRDVRVQDAVVSLSRACTYAFLGYQAVNGGVTTGEAVLAIAWLETINKNLYQFVHFQRYKNEGVEGLHELAEMLSTKPRVSQADNPICLSEMQGRVQFEEVSFAYSDDDQSVLTDISFDIAPHQTVALVGPSGCGKSTTVSMLLREYDPTSGYIFIDGVPLTDIDYDWFRQEAVGIVDQNIKMFETTIAENIRLGNPTATDEEVIEAAKKADIHHFIMKKPDGYQTMVGEDGIRLSGGQIQRIAIARALVKKPRLLILDEATSSLDGISQAEVQKAIDKLIAARECTIFIIAHRFSTVESTDIVIVLNDGYIEAMGTHEEMQRQNGLYNTLKNLEQSGGLAA